MTICDVSSADAINTAFLCFSTIKFSFSFFPTHLMLLLKQLKNKGFGMQ